MSDSLETKNSQLAARADYRSPGGVGYWIESAVERWGNATALRFRGEALSYSALNERANRCAHYLRDLGVGPDVVVGVLMDRSFEMIVGLLAILKAGGAYLPLATDYPAERLGFILRDSGVSIVLTCQQSARALEGFDVNVISLDAEVELMAGMPTENPETRTGPEDLAYVIYTSGSTGKPKGCLIEHASICNRLLWMRDHYGITEADRILQKTPSTFDVSVWEFFLPLISGATLVLAKPGGHKDNAYLQELIRAERVTVCHFVPSMLRFFLRQAEAAACTSLRHVFASGEALPHDLMQQCLRTLPAKLHNLYGPTETAVDVTYWECVERPDQKVPIGRPISNTGMYILDEKLQPVPRGESGELFVSGIGVGRGYLNRPELTRERFIRNPFSQDPGSRLYRTGDKVQLLSDGEIEYIGRLDFQVKLRGFRIELGEIEETLRSHEAIEDAAVLVRDQAGDDPKLVAYLILRKRPLSAKEVRDFVKQKLPEYMVPNLVAALPAFPMSAHGKLDRAALPWPISGELSSSTAAGPVPVAAAASNGSAQVNSSHQSRLQHPAETVFSQLADAEIAADLRGLFQRSLGLGALSETGDLFDLGATSFTMVQAVEHIRAQYGVVVPVDVFFDTPTVKDLAAYVAQRTGKPASDPRCPSCSNGSEAAPAPVAAIRLETARFKDEAFGGVLPVRQFSGRAVPLSSLGRLLSLLRCSPERVGPKYLYSSAGGLRAVQTYIFVRENGVAGLPEGYYYYHPQEHSLYSLQTGPRLGVPAFCPFDRPVFTNAGFALFLVAQMEAIQAIYANASPVLTVVEAGYMAQMLMEHQPAHGVGLSPVAGVDFESVRDGFQLQSTHQFIHCLLGGTAASPVTERPTERLTDFLKVNGPGVHAHCSNYSGERTFAHFLDAQNQSDGLPTIEQKEELHRKHLHFRTFGREVNTVHLEAWVPEAGYYLLRAAKRTYRDGVIGFGRFSRFMALLGEDVRRGFGRHLYPSVVGTHPLKFYVYVKLGGVENIDEGLYRYDPSRHELHLTAQTLSADLKSCYTPFNRIHYKAAKFCLFLVAPTAKLKPFFGEDSTYLSLLESGYIGQLLLDRQAEFELGVCPIGGMRYEKIREDFKLEPDDVFLHSFVGGEVTPECDIPWEPLEMGCQRAEAALPEGQPQQASARHAVAVVGISGRFPGAPDIATLGMNLREGKGAFKEVRFDQPETYRCEAWANGEQGASRHWGGFLDDVDCFDSQLFRITPAEARSLDPQERLFLETAWECLENGGYTGAELNRVAGKVGVFVGAMWDDYQHYHSDERTPSRPGLTVSALHSSIANRVSFFFNFKGPSVAVNTSCSSAMTALHFGCQSVLNGECGAALVGGVNLMAHPYHQSVLSSMELLSADEVCRPFGLKANGWVAGEGVGAVLLKRLSDAIRDGDTICGVILGTTISHSGETGRYGAPSSIQQAQSIREALAQAGAAAESISYIEAAAPGAGMADASEAAAIKEVFGKGNAAGVLHVGSIKANIGHLESASAMSQLAKVLLQMKDGRIFPTIQFQPTSPLVQWQGTGLKIPDTVAEWDRKGGNPRRALINAYGATGSAGHLVIEEYAAPELSGNDTETLIVLSAATKEQLTTAARRLCTFLDQPESASARILDIGHTLRVGRKHMKVRLATVVRSRRELQERLKAFLDGIQTPSDLYFGEAGAVSCVELRDSDLHAVAVKWVAGACELGRLETGARRVPLPTYPFARERHWIGTPPEARDPEALPISAMLRSKAEAYLKGLFSRVTEIPCNRIDAQAMFDAYGMTSLMVKQLNELLGRDFGELSSALLFERQTIGELAEFFMAHHLEKLRALCGEASSCCAQAEPAGRPERRLVAAESSPRCIERAGCRMAVVGISGKYPKAENISAFWENLKNGIDCITEIPADRWDDARLQAEAGKHSRWGGFIDGCDEFDPFFFKISPREALEMDPQERLFLQVVWHLFEDAGYAPSKLSRELRDRLGVFVGVMYGEYQLHSCWEQKDGGLPVTALYGSIANRISYTLDFHGPSMAVDTLCSSSLTALHLAVQSIQSGECDAAVVGGVNLSIHPNKYVLHARMSMSSTDGRCRSFGKGGDGFVPGEGVGAVLIKPLDHALRDGDQIYGVIRSTAINHDGKTHGYTVPNPNAQAAMISKAIRVAGVDPRLVSYVEAHGTGTALGDPIEISGLSKAFGEFTSDRQYCAIGSVKSNIGHLESAAGIAGLTKVLLQMKHRQLAPSLHSRELNPEIRFEKTPFFVPQVLTDWKCPISDKNGVTEAGPRIACISSFGAGGSNGHVIIEEYDSAEPPEPAEEFGKSQLIVLSAKDPDRLQAVVAQLHEFTRRNPACRLVDLAYTLQVGREVLDERLAFTVNSFTELEERLRAIREGHEDSHSIYRGRMDRQATLSSLLGDEDLQQSIVAWIDKRKFDKILQVWVEGADVDWRRLHVNTAPRKVSLPAYPFARERYWVPKRPDPAGVITSQSSWLHPLLHRNTSDLWEQRFSSTFNGREFFLNDHRLRGVPVLPAAACLEMARAAVEQATRGQAGQIRLRNVAWVQPLTVSSEGETVHASLRLAERGAVQFEIYSGEPSSARTVISQGSASFSQPEEAPKLDLKGLFDRLPKADLSPAQCYATFRSFGLEHGDAFLSLREIRRDAETVLAKVAIPPSAVAARASYLLHPSLLDGLFQATIALGGPTLSSKVSLPYALEELTCYRQCEEEMWGYIRPGNPQGSKLDLDLCNAEGMVCVQIKGFSTREIETDRPSAVLSRPVLRDAFTSGSNGSVPSWGRHYVVTCGAGLRAIQASDLQGATWVSLEIGEGNLADRFEAAAVQTFELIKRILSEKAPGEILFQVLISSGAETGVYRGLSGLLRTAHQENPAFRGQLIELGARAETENIPGILAENRLHPEDEHICYEGGRRKLVSWESLPADQSTSRSLWKEQGVYLITGGAGGLGFLFADEIARRIKSCVLVLVGRSAMSPKLETRLRALERPGMVLQYKQVDVADAAAVNGLVQGIVKEHGALHGILHAAGVVRDNFILKKTPGELCSVLAPKVRGAVHLDEATRELDLDFFALFSSTVGALGNAGQADYAAANAFLDGFAEHRNTWVRDGKRRGHTFSINWPLWQDGGMKAEAGMLEFLKANSGLELLETFAGLEAFGTGWRSKYSQIMVQAVPRKTLRSSFAKSQVSDAPPSAPAFAAIPEDAGAFAEKALRFFRGLLASTVQCSLERIKVDEPFDSYGIDSVMVMQMTNELEKTFGSLSKTLFFEYHTVRSLAGHFLETRAEALARLLGGKPTLTTSMPVETPPGRQGHRLENVTPGLVSVSSPAPSDALDIAIIGLAGRYPQANDLETFWQNLSQGRDCITDIPAERWDWKEFYDPERKRPGGHYGKRGGFIDHVDAFDPLFFNIAPRDARYMDPQERLFLETTWAALEDAGYRARDLRGNAGPYLTSQVGVYAGVMYSEYQLFAHEQTLAGNPTAAGNIYASIANHVSYFLDLHGPSMTLDTMCSSSLTCIHLACLDLKNKTTDLALAGGVNVTIHPNKFLLLSEGQFISGRGCCASFGQGGDGYVPGEGVGVVVLKRLADAIRDGDRIYGVIKGSAVNHGGKTNGFTVPNPLAQHEVIARAMKMAGMDPSRISCVEAHSTGTPLGDPIEVSGLRKAFESRRPDAGPCFLGSVKSNIGHCEAAAGIAGLTKVLLQMQHGKLAPSLHSQVLNPHLELDQTPFEVNQVLRDWDRQVLDGRPQPYAAGISGFGAGGSNAHLIVEEYAVSPEPAREANGRDTFVILLSARNEKRLIERAVQLHRFLKSCPSASLSNLAYTLQVGREPMEERLGFTVSSTEELLDLLGQVIRGNPGPLIHRGRVADGAAETLRTLVEDEDADLSAAIERWVRKGKQEKLIDLWVSGLDLDWNALYGTARPRRISLPTYPFARDRYWLSGKDSASSVVKPGSRPAHQESSSLDWLALREEWQPEPWSEALLDWDSLLRNQQSRRVTLLVSDEAEGRELARLVKQLEEQAGMKSGVPLEIVLLKDLDAWRMDRIPEVILLAAPYAGNCDGDRHHVSALFHLIQKLMREAWDSSIRVYHVYDCSLVQPRLRLEALGGLLRSAMQENEHHVWTSISIQGCASVEARNQVLLREWLADDAGVGRFSGIQYQGAERQRHRLVECHADPAAQPVFRPNGTYVLAGGLGPVGELLCCELARRYGARLVLLSRSELDNGKREQCRRLESLGASVSYYQVDITDRPALEAVWQRVKAEVGTIHGVIHLARLVEDGLLLSKSWDEFARVSRAKVEGTLNLDELTAAEPLDFFLLFSSMAAFGMRGSADYGYSSAFQNAFAAHRARLAGAGDRSGKTVACGWGPWSVDKYFSEDRNGQLRESGFSLIDMEQAFPWIESKCWGSEPFLGLMLVHDGVKARSELNLDNSFITFDALSRDVEERIEAWEERKRAGGQITPAEVGQVLQSDRVGLLSEALINRLHTLLTGSGNGSPQEEQETDQPGVARDGDITQTIKLCLADILGLTEVDETKPFQNYGMNSISAMRFALLLEKRLKLPVLPQSLPEYPTVRALAAHLASEAALLEQNGNGRAV